MNEKGKEKYKFREATNELKSRESPTDPLKHENAERESLKKHSIECRRTKEIGKKMRF